MKFNTDTGVENLRFSLYRRNLSGIQSVKKNKTNRTAWRCDANPFYLLPKQLISFGVTLNW